MKNIPKISFQSENTLAGFEIIKLSSLFNRMPDFADHNPYKPHRLSFFALIIVTKGSGSHEVDLKKHDISKGTVLKLAKGQIHSFQKEATYDGFLVIFTESFIINYFSKSSINLISHLYNYHITTPILKNVVESKIFVNEINKELQAQDVYAKENIIAAFLELYLLKIERASGADHMQNKNPDHYISFVKFRSLVENEYTITRNVKDYALKMGVSTKYLNVVVNEITFNSPKQFIDDYVTLEAKRAIATTNDSFKEIAYEIGFDEVTNFTKFFKKNMKMTPKEFRLSQFS